MKYAILSDTTGVYDIVDASCLDEAAHLAHVKFSPDNWRVTSYDNFIKYNYKYNDIIRKWQKQADIKPIKEPTKKRRRISENIRKLKH